MHKFKLPGQVVVAALCLFAALCSAQTITIISGDGQLVCPACGPPGQFTPLIVQVNDATGALSTNTTVTWTVVQQGQTTITATSTTGTNGQASYTFAPYGFFIGTNFLPATITAAALGKSVQFVETTTQPVLGAPPTSISLIPYGSAPTLSGAVGSTGTTPIQVQIFGDVGPLPNVGVYLQSGTSGQPTVTCSSAGSPQAGMVFSDSHGIATCAPVFGGKLGSNNSYTIVIGGGYDKFTGKFSVTAGPAGAIKYISGNNQTTVIGSATAVPLTAEVTDVGGNLVANAPVTWAVSSGSATLSNVISTSSSTGIVSARVTPTAGPGPISVTVSLPGNATAQYTFTVKISTPPVTGLSALSPLTEVAKENAAFPDPIIVQVLNGSAPLSGITVTFTATAGVTLSSSSVVSDSNGQAQVTATAGDAPATATVTASVSNAGHTYTQTFTLTVILPGPIISDVMNAAGFQSQFVSPCSLATIFGTGLATNVQGVVASFLQPQTTVAGVSVTFNGIAAPILDVANVGGQESVSVQIPCELGSLTLPSTVSMVVTADSDASQPFDVTVSTYSPGIFQSFDATDGVQRAVLVRPDGTYVSVTNPARRGEVIRMFVTGLGQTSPALFTNEFDPLVQDDSGNMVPQALKVQASLVVGVNNSGVAVISANYAYGMVGVYEVDFEVPSDTATGSNQPFAIAVVQGNTLLFGNGSKIPIQ